MKRKTQIKIVTYISALIVVLSGFVLKFANESYGLRYAGANANLHAVSELSDSLVKVSNSLTKSVYARSPELLASVTAEIWNHSAAALMSVAALPLSDVSLERTQTFIARVGDFAYYIARRAASHTDLTLDEREALSSLSDTALALSQEVLTIENDIYTGNINFNPDPSGNLSSAVRSFSGVEEEFPEYLSSDYDGMMSGHILTRVPKLLTDAGEINAETARAAAAAALGRDVGEVLYQNENGGAIPTYNFYTEDGACAEICKKGGYLLSLRRFQEYAEGSADIDTLLNNAKEYLTDVGYTGMEPVYYYSEGGIALYRFIYCDDGVAYYPDLITVGVSMTDGSVLSLNAQDYVMNHTAREVEAPAVTPREAARIIGEELSPSYVGRVVINTSGLYEVQCHEFLCTSPNGQKMFIYCDAESGDERKMILINEGEDGVILT